MRRAQEKKSEISRKNPAASGPTTETIFKTWIEKFFQTKTRHQLDNMTETSLAKKYQKWEHMDVDDEVPEKKEDPVAAARRQLEQDVQLPPEELVRHSPEKAPKEERSEPHEEDAASTKSSRATLVEQMDEMDLGVSGLLAYIF